MLHFSDEYHILFVSHIQHLKNVSWLFLPFWRNKNSSLTFREHFFPGFPRLSSLVGTLQHILYILHESHPISMRLRALGLIISTLHLAYRSMLQEHGNNCNTESPDWPTYKGHDLRAHRKGQNYLDFELFNVLPSLGCLWIMNGARDGGEGYYGLFSESMCKCIRMFSWQSSVWSNTPLSEPCGLTELCMVKQHCQNPVGCHSSVWSNTTVRILWVARVMYGQTPLSGSCGLTEFCIVKHTTVRILWVARGLGSILCILSLQPLRHVCHSYVYTCWNDYGMKCDALNIRCCSICSANPVGSLHT